MFDIIQEGPFGEPAVSLEEARSHLDVYGFTDDDNQIQMYVQAATERVEAELNMALREGTFTKRFHCFAPILPLSGLSPVKELLSVSYIDEEGETRPVFVNDYYLIPTLFGSVVSFDPSFSFPTIQPGRPDAISVKFKAGYAPGDVPASLKSAIMLMAGTLYEQRETLVDGKLKPSDVYESLIWPWKKTGV